MLYRYSELLKSNKINSKYFNFNKIKNDSERLWYINQTSINCWGYYDLLDKILNFNKHTSTHT